MRSRLDADGTATFDTLTLGVGEHTITAQYEGDSNYAASSDSLLQTVAPRAILTWSRPGDGNWDSDNWDVPGQRPTPSIGAVVETPYTVTVDSGQAAYLLRIRNGGQVSIVAGGSLDVVTGVTLGNGGTVYVGGGGTLVTGEVDETDESANLHLGGGIFQAGSSFSTTVPITLGAGDGTIDSNGHDLSLAGTITGPGGVTITGGGTVTISGDNHYDRGTVVSAATLVVAGASALPPGGGLTIGAGGAVVLTSGLGKAIELGSLSIDLGTGSPPPASAADNTQPCMAALSTTSPPLTDIADTRIATIAVADGNQPAAMVSSPGTNRHMAETATRGTRVSLPLRAKPAVLLFAAPPDLPLNGAAVRTPRPAETPAAAVLLSTDPATVHDAVLQAARPEPFWDQLGWLRQSRQSGFARSSKKKDAWATAAVDQLMATAWH